MFMRRTQTIDIFGNISTLFGPFAIFDPSVKIFTGDRPRESLRRGLNASGVAKYSDRSKAISLYLSLVWSNYLIPFYSKF